jgi:hypothetical protein
MRKLVPSLALVNASAVPLDNPFLSLTESFWEKLPEEYTNSYEQYLIDIQAIKCDACKATSWIVSNTLGERYVQLALTDLVIVACGFVIEEFGYKRDVCPGIIKQQFGDSILPIFADQIMSELNLCTFIFNVCDAEKYEM